MSRRIVFFFLASAAALIVSPAFADRECFENSCRLPGAVELPPQPEPEASAAVEEPQPEFARRVAPAPGVLSPANTLTSAVQAKAVRHPAPLAPAPNELRTEQDVGDAVATGIIRLAPARNVRNERASVSPAGQNAASAGTVIIAVPGTISPGYGSVYAVAPNAKIISIESAD
jgi:hypothetical protein